MHSEENRSTTNGMMAMGTELPGVGARQEGISTPRRGGGYQDICTNSDAPLGAQKNARDPRIEELRKIGLGAQWTDVADAIGFDAFVAMWRALDHHAAGENQRLYIPRFSAYARYQRNRYIQSLADAGEKADTILCRVKDELCETISYRHISRIIGKA